MTASPGPLGYQSTEGPATVELAHPKSESLLVRDVPAAQTVNPESGFDERVWSGPGKAVEPEGQDWLWVEEWRQSGEPVPWGPGLTIAVFAAMVVGSAVYVLSSGLADNTILAAGVNIIVAGGLAPAIWLSRSLPVLRWISGGAAAGVLIAWVADLMFLL